MSRASLGGQLFKGFAVGGKQFATTFGWNAAFGKRDEHSAHRFLDGPTRWAGDASNAEAEIGAGFFSRAFGHGAGHRFADGSVQGEEPLRHVDGANLCLVGIGDETFEKDERSARARW